jgi:hypothetical protein
MLRGELKPERWWWTTGRVERVTRSRHRGNVLLNVGFWTMRTRIHRSVRQNWRLCEYRLRAEYRICGIGVSRVITDQGSTRESTLPQMKRGKEREGREGRYARC